MLTTVLGTLNYINQQHVDTDLTDGLNSYVTVNLLIGFSILISWKQFGGKPIECMVPDMFSGAWEQMAMSTLLSSWGEFSLAAKSYDSDLVDDLNRSITTNILLLFSVLTSFKMFGQPIECLEPDVPPHSSFEAYTENYCWAQDTYFLPFDEQVPQDVNERENKRISYYQWVPFFLLLEAASFRLPSLIWKYLAHHSGIKIHDIVKLAVDPKNVEPMVRKANIDALTTHIQNALRFHRRVHRKQVRPHNILRFLNIPYSAFFVTTMYLITKLAYIFNVALQLLLMNKFLETDRYSWYGFGALRDLLNGTQWDKSGVFPRVSLCDFQVRVMGNVQRYSVQCVLVINIFNEKIFIFLWFWYVLLLVLTTLSFIYWFFVAVMPCPKMSFVRRHLELSDMPFDPRGNKMELDRFVNRYLKLDGVFVLRMINMHSGVIFGTDLTLNLWKAFYGIEDSYRRSTGETPMGGGSAFPVAGAAPLSGQQENLANYLRQRKGKGDDGGQTRHLLTSESVPAAKSMPPAIPMKPTAPSADSAPRSLDLPDCRNPRLGMAPRGDTFDEGVGSDFKTARHDDSE